MMWEWHAFFDGKVTYDHETGCVLYAKFVDELGYGRARRVAGEVKTHRISVALSYGPILEGMHVLHSCDVRHCVNPFHLSVGTHAENMADMAAKGRANCPVLIGSQRPNTVLDEDKVWAIRQCLRMGMFTQAEISRSYGVAPMTVSRVAQNKSWQHVTPNWPYDNKGTWQ